MADHHVRPAQGCELRVHERRHRRVAERGARVGDVGQRGQPQRLAERLEALAGDPVELGRASASIPSSTSSDTNPGRHGRLSRRPPARTRTTGASSARRPCSRRRLNIWIP